MAGKGGGAWKVAYADFVTAMMAFFMVMWIVGQNKPLKKAVAEYFRTSRGVQTRPGGSTSILPNTEGGAPPGGKYNKGQSGRPNEDTAKRAGDPSETEGTVVMRPKLLALHDGNSFNTGTVIPFADDAAELNEVGKKRLDLLVPELLGKPNKIEIRGHASPRPLPGDSPYKTNWELSYGRSLATMKYLTDRGIEPQRFRLSQAGVYEPKSLDLDASVLAQNARVEVYVLAEYAENLMGTKKERTAQVKTEEENDFGPASKAETPDEQRRGKGSKKPKPSSERAPVSAREPAAKASNPG